MESHGQGREQAGEVEGRVDNGWRLKTDKGRMGV